MPNFLTLALAQVEGSPIPEKNLETARILAAEASARKAEILVFPEMFMAIPQKSASLPDIAETADGHFVKTLGKIAETHHLCIVSGIWEKIPGNPRVNNAAVMLSPEGKIITIYRKLHLFDALNIRESEKMIQGNELPEIVNIKGIQTGLAICYDLRFPELFRYMAFQGADLVIVPSGWYAGQLKEDHWHTLLRARAVENTMYIAGVNLTGSVFCGRSTVFDPFGVSKAEAGEGAELLVVQINTERICEVRTKLPSIQHCRPEIFDRFLKFKILNPHDKYKKYENTDCYCKYPK